MTQATNYDTNLDAVGDTRVDTLRHCQVQLELAGYAGTVAVLNPVDYERIELTKNLTGGGGQYIVGDPGSAGALWRMRIVSSAAMTAGNFLVFDGARGAVLYDRQQASVEISREHAEFFVANMVAILAEERVALVVPDALALVAGSFPTS